MTVEVEFECETDEEIPARLKIARPVLREDFESYLDEKIKEISRELEKSGYAEIEYRQSEEVVHARTAWSANIFTKRTAHERYGNLSFTNG